jgi:phosphatidylserine/phosphatidylglycerophosphate/cardiolipin synthase-like enzyme
MSTSKEKNGFSVTAYPGDAKTLLAFNLPQADAKNLAGFTIQCAIGQNQQFYVFNELQFEDPSKHYQDAVFPPTSSINAPIHKFRWVHVPGSLNQGTKPVYGQYTYTVTPRYFDNNGSLQRLDPQRSVQVSPNVGPFSKGLLDLGFTRGFTQSEAFVHHFGLGALFRPPGKDLLFDTSQISGKTAAGQAYTFAEEYEWLGFTARTKILAILNEVLSDQDLAIDVFAYDLNEPDIMQLLLTLAAQGRTRIILDNAALHHSAKSPKPEDQFEQLFRQKAKAPAAILRRHFGRYSHDKVIIVSKGNTAVKVLTGSTNFSITGLYVNSNHVVVFNQPDVAAAYAKVFEDSWSGKASEAFNKTAEANEVFTFNAKNLSTTDITFSPHPPNIAAQNLNDMATRIAQEAQQAKNRSVLFAVMALNQGGGPVLPALEKIHEDASIFSYGISDSPGGIELYARGKKTGVLVSGKPGHTLLPPPFDQVPQVGGLGHQVHHKFVVCGFNGDNPVVYCGSSNLALGGEEENGDNLIAIHDGDVATVFAIEALALVDHFDFLDRSEQEAKSNGKGAPNTSASRQQLAKSVGWFLSTTDQWAAPYFDRNDLHFVDRELFGVTL